MILGEGGEEAFPMRSPFIEMDTEAEHIKVKDGQPVTFVCRVGGYPQPRLVFYKDDKRIRPNENIRIGTRLWLTNISYYLAYWPFLWGLYLADIYSLRKQESNTHTHTHKASRKACLMILLRSVCCSLSRKI